MPASVNAKSYDRKELDVDLFAVFAIAIGITFGTYLLFLPARDSYLGTLLFERGFTQFVVMFLASVVVVMTVLKYLKLTKETRILRKNWIPELADASDPNSRQLVNLQRSLALDKSLIAVRCSRVLAAYRNSGSRQAATDLALDDSSFYTSASESSYALPRILVWAIPLFGFIGTVVGISQAVTGFSGFLEEAGEIAQIKEGIGTVTSGLATAFDTTLLALFLSVIVMIPLVLVERFESRLLLAIDIFINDKLLPKLRQKSETIDEETINKAIDRAVKEHIANPEALIEPAREYAQLAATQLAEGFVAEVGKIKEMSAELIEQMGQVNRVAQQDRQEFVSTFGKQQQASKQTVLEVREMVEEIKAGYSSISADLAGQGEQIRYQLEQGAKALETRIMALEKSTNRVSEFARLQQSLEQNLRSIEEAALLKEVLTDVKSNLARLQPTLEQLGKPRRIRLVEEDERI